MSSIPNGTSTFSSSFILSVILFARTAPLERIPITQIFSAPPFLYRISYVILLIARLIVFSSIISAFFFNITSIKATKKVPPVKQAAPLITNQEYIFIYT